MMSTLLITGAGLAIANIVLPSGLVLLKLKKDEEIARWMVILDQTISQWIALFVFYFIYTIFP